MYSSLVRSCALGTISIIFAAIQSELLLYEKTTTTVVTYHVKMVNTSKFYCLLSKEGLGCSLRT